MRKWICCIIILALAACCACAFAEDVPTLAFEETERVNYKPVVAGNPPGFEVDTWLQKMVVKPDQILNLEYVVNMVEIHHQLNSVKK